MDYITPDSLYLCLDQGGHASRAILFNHEGSMVASAFREVKTEFPARFCVEQDPLEVLDSIRDAMRDVLGQVGAKQKQVVSAGLATQRSSIVCWDRQTGEPLSPIISWQDRRNTDWLRQFSDRNEHIHKLTGLFLSPHYGASKLRWCLENIPEVQAAHKAGRLAMGPMSSYLASQLVSEDNWLVDPVNASRTQLYNLKQHDWDEELLQLFTIPRESLPQPVSSVYDFGHINNGEQSIPLRLVTGDQSAAMYAYGELQPDTAYVNTGTGAFLSRLSGPLQLYSRRLLTSIIFQDEEHKTLQNYYVLEGTVNGAGSALEWLAKQYPDSDIYTPLPQWLEEVEVPPLFLNGVSGLGAPFWIADFISEFNRQGTVAEKAVSIIESIVFLLKSSLDEMSKLSSPPEQIQVTGGLARYEGLNQRLADLSGLPVYVPVECEATSRGTAFLLADQPHHWPEQEAGIWLEPRDNPALQQRYQDWLALMLQKMRRNPLQPPRIKT